MDLVEYDLGGHTKIFGDNGQGKTTIGEAIAWVILGADLTGNERATTRLINDKCKDMYVELKFLFKGEQHTLTRRKKGSAISIFLDDKTVKQTDLINFYNSKELFLSIFNPTYFPALTPKDAKAVLDSELGEVKKVDVYKELPKSVVKVLEATAFGNPNLYLENKRERLKEIEQDTQYWNGFMEGKKEDVEIPDHIPFDEAPLEKLRKKLAEINALKVVVVNDIAGLMSKREALKADVYVLDAQIKGIESAVPQVADTKALELELNTLRTQYSSQQSLLKTLDNRVNCPKCETVIDLDGDRKQSIAKELEKLKVDGVKLASDLEKVSKNNAELVKAHEKKVKEQVEHKSKEISKLQAEIDSLNIDKLTKENEVCAKECEDEIAVTRNTVMLQIQALEDARQKVLMSNAQREDILKRQEDMLTKTQDAKTQITELGQEKEDILRHIEYAKEYNSKRLQIQANQIDKHLDKVTIQLEKIIQSTGEVKADFKILYDGKEFAVLSKSEEIKAGLEIANLLMNVSGLTVPVFVDNAESITVIPKMDTQMIEARVKEDTELTVEVA